MQHYKKLITVLTVTFLMLSLLVSQAFAAVFQYNMFDYYNHNVVDSYWTHYVNDNGSSTGSDLVYQNGTRDPSNNRFTCTVEPNAVFYNHMYRFDLWLRFRENVFTFNAGDVISTKFHLSSNCQFITDKTSASTGQFYLHFYRIWFEDSSTLVYYPQHNINYAFSVNDYDYDFSFPTLMEDRPRITQIQLSFNLVKPVSYRYADSTSDARPYINIWFGKSFMILVNRDPLNQSWAPEDDTIIKDQQQLEDQIYNDIDDGLNGASDMWDSFGTLVSNDGRLYKGLMFVTNLLNKFLGIEIFSILGTFGLSLGIFAFLIGIVQLIKSSAERKQREQNRNNRR